MSQQEKLEQLAEIEGFDDYFSMLQEAVFDGICPAICTNTHCTYTSELEPDASKCLCEICDTPTVDSCLIIAGII